MTSATSRRWSSRATWWRHRSTTTPTSPTTSPTHSGRTPPSPAPSTAASNAILQHRDDGHGRGFEELH
ncbi:unnamed protein product [Musa acuminata subsp. malaccensis]|uniref:(wild Malaysian banana) hypothetical protein n=1 Tax=Musa acuminata subsp. malaccensis TaxID=214687 RepID=A0A804IGE4_MUSAM|nr:unnamed protein product [Musa acuminata subsp. malaccensis]